MVLGGISQFFPSSFGSIIIGVYVILFGIGKLLLVFGLLFLDPLFYLCILVSYCVHVLIRFFFPSSCRSFGIPSYHSGLRIPLCFVSFLFPGTWCL